jgi:hypothetical protein
MTDEKELAMTRGKGFAAVKERRIGITPSGSL